MWDETLIESNRRRAGKRTWVTAACAFAFHAAIVIVILAASFWYLEAVTPAQIPNEPIYRSVQLPSDVIPVVVRQGTPRGNDKRDPHQPAQIVSQKVSQDNIDPNREIDLDSAQPSIPFNLEDVEAGGTGPRGDPHGDSDQGAFTGSGEITDQPQVITTDMESPVVLKRIDPEYPEIMRRAKVQGTVILSAVISRTGDVQVKEVLMSLNNVMDGAAIRAVNQWKYRPATLNGRPISVWFTITVSYKLR